MGVQVRTERACSALNASIIQAATQLPPPGGCRLGWTMRIFFRCARMVTQGGVSHSTPSAVHVEGISRAKDFSMRESVVAQKLLAAVGIAKIRVKLEHGDGDLPQQIRVILDEEQLR